VRVKHLEVGEATLTTGPQARCAILDYLITLALPQGSRGLRGITLIAMGMGEVLFIANILWAVTHRLIRDSSMLVLLLWLTSCNHSPRSDDQLIAAFQRHHVFFDRIVGESYAGPPDCPFANDPDVCEPKNAKTLRNLIKQELALPVEGVYRKRRRGDSLWIPIETRGILSMSSFTRGYVYCKCSLTPLTKDTLGEPENGSWYRPIGDGWMLYIAR
jgi:hypothetical protein